MKLDTTRILKDWQGTAILNDGARKPDRKDKQLTVGELLAGHLASGTYVPKEKRTRATVLSIRLEQGWTNGVTDLALSDKDVKLILEVVEAIPNLPPWLVGAIHYFVNPESLDKDELETMKFFDSPPENADGNGTDQHQNPGTSRVSDSESRSA